MSEADTATPTYVTRLNQAGVERAANPARRVGTGLLVVAAIGLLAWVWMTLRALGLLGDGWEGLAFEERLDVIAAAMGLLVYSSLAAGAGVALRLVAGYTVA